MTGDNVAARLRSLVLAAAEVGPLFKARAYMNKRFLEIIILATDDPERRSAEFDLVGDLWPLGPGTKTGVAIIFPDAQTDQQCREALRALQRLLGNGARRVSLLRISAFLCFWERALNQSLSWPVARFGAYQ